LKDIKDYEIKVLKRQLFVNNLKAWIVGIILVVEVILVISFLSSLDIYDEVSPSKNKIAVIRYNKEVTEEFTTKVMEEMDKIRNDKSYKSVLFIMGSPGGSPTASEELSEYLKDYQKDKNITMYIDSMAASGGYYIASAIKPLYANKNAIVGSIGVIMPHYNFGELAKKVGVEEDFMAAGKFKKPISMLAKIDTKTKEYITKNLLKPTYNNFINSVAKNRGIDVNKLKPFTEGKIFVANMPEIKGILIDKISSLYKIKKMIRNSIKAKDTDFVNINLEKEEVLFPKVKVDLDLKEAINRLHPTL
jgi:protease-4